MLRKDKYQVKGLNLHCTITHMTLEINELIFNCFQAKKKKTIIQRYNVEQVHYKHIYLKNSIVLYFKQENC